MSEKFVYVTYIRTTPQKLWDALLKPEFQRAYWFGMEQECDWNIGSVWKMKFPDGRVADAGEVLEIDPLKRVVVKWRNEFRPELKEEGFSRATYELETVGDTVRLTVTHEIGKKDSKFIQAVSGGWPKVLASLKSLLETGKALPEIHHYPK
jgi:uncharacterized protein YndB with AHSA1/START domain